MILCAPVIDPLGRYHYARKLKAAGPPYPPLVDEVLPCHDAYWQTEEAMAEGCPALALEKGEKVELPPALYLQGTEDLAHPRPQLDRFVAAYRKAGGVVDLEPFDGEGQGFIMRKAGSPASNRAIEMISFKNWISESRKVEPLTGLRAQHIRPGAGNGRSAGPASSWTWQGASLRRRTRRAGRCHEASSSPRAGPAVMSPHRLRPALH